MKKILIIDDETPTLEMLELFLGALGYSVHTATNEADGFETFMREKPPIILTDIKRKAKILPDRMVFLSDILCNLGISISWFF